MKATKLVAKARKAAEPISRSLFCQHEGAAFFIRSRLPTVAEKLCDNFPLRRLLPNQ